MFEILREEDLSLMKDFYFPDWTEQFHSRLPNASHLIINYDYEK